MAIFDTDETSIDTFPTMNKLRNGSDPVASIQVSVRTSRAEAIKDLVSAVKDKMQRQPVLVFLSKNDPIA